MHGTRCRSDHGFGFVSAAGLSSAAPSCGRGCSQTHVASVEVNTVIERSGCMGAVEKHHRIAARRLVATMTSIVFPLLPQEPHAPQHASQNLTCSKVQTCNTVTANLDGQQSPVNTDARTMRVSQPTFDVIASSLVCWCRVVCTSRTPTSLQQCRRRTHVSAPSNDSRCQARLGIGERGCGGVVVWACRIKGCAALCKTGAEVVTGVRSGNVCAGCGRLR